MKNILFHGGNKILYQRTLLLQTGLGKEKLSIKFGPTSGYYSNTIYFLFFLFGVNQIKSTLLYV